MRTIHYRLIGTATLAAGLLVLTVLTRPAKAITWIHETAHLSESRNKAVATTAGDKVLFAGGESLGSTKFSTVDMYDVDTQAWSVSSLSQARDELCAASLGDRAYFAGGALPGGAITDRVDIYDSISGQWSTAALSQERFGAAAAATGEKVMFAGGWSASGQSSVVDIYDGSTGLWSTSALSQARSHAAATTCGDLAFFAGGLLPQYEYSDVVDIYDTATGQWSAHTLSQPRAYLSATTAGSNVIFAGGKTGDHSYSDVVDIYDVATDTWSVSNLSVARGFLNATSLGQLALIGGGSGWGTGVDEKVVVDVYDTGSGTWSTEYLAEGRNWLAATTAGDCAFFAGGHIGGNQDSDMVDIFRIPDLAPLLLSVDIRPGSDVNPVNLTSRGVLPVVVYGSEQFDVEQIDLSSLAMEGTGPNEKGNSGEVASVEYIDGDSWLDLVLHFDIQDLDIDATAEQLILSGVLLDGTAFEGADSIRIVPPGDLNGDLVVDIIDLTAMAGNWSALSGGAKGWAQGDCNGDSVVDILDLTALAANWGAETIVIPGGAVPEPTALVLLGLGGLVLIRRRRK